MNENTTVRLHIGRLVVDAGTPLPPGGVPGLQAALESALAAQWSGQAPPGLPAPAGAGDARTAAWVQQMADAISAALPAHDGFAAGSTDLRSAAGRPSSLSPSC